MSALAAENTESLLTVSELNRLGRLVLERAMPSCRVIGEISNFNRAGSGHWYFTLKDETASVRAVMFRTRNQFVDWNPRDGDHVELRAQPTLYEPRGDYQLMVDALRKAGQGQLFEAFLKLKEKLEREGLFSENRKRTLPQYPKCVGIVTSPHAAALRDVLTTLRSRWPMATAMLYPTPVQGEGAVRGIVTAIESANLLRECDVLLLVRGGGGLEDLHAFNDELVARAITGSYLPVITGIGHETDFTIADFVADKRAPTPTGAAQCATPSTTDQLGVLLNARGRLCSALTRKTQGISQLWDALSKRLKHPEERIMLKRQQLQHGMWRMHKNVEKTVIGYRARLDNTVRLSQDMGSVLSGQKARLSGLTRRSNVAVQSYVAAIRNRSVLLDHQLRLLDPASILRRGYGIVRNSRGEVVTHYAAVAVGESLNIKLAHGGIEAEVKCPRSD